LVFHAHLPYVRHPDHDYFLEENWFYEAVTETYIPLINVLEGLLKDEVDFRLTVALSPTLLSMFNDSFLQERYLRHLHKLIDLANREVDRTRWQPEFHDTALMYQNLFNRARETFADRYGRNLIGAFRGLQDSGKVELISCGATHGYLPLMGLHRESVRAQVATAVDVHTRLLGKKPRGIWLPECGYNPGDDWILREFGIRFFFLDTHGVLFASHRPKYGVFAPIYCRSGVAAFGRDPESSKQVWSMDEGYPGDFDYREYYRDVGWDLDLDYVRPYVHPDGTRINTGIKYYRITGKTNHKEPYNAVWAGEKAAVHAGNFMFNREKQIEYLAGKLDRPPLIVSPYDAELFGHWWFEGPLWLNYLFRKLAYDQETVEPITPSEYLQRYPCNQVPIPCQSSWGNKGYHDVWLEGSNDWIYRHLHKATERMIEQANYFPDAGGLLRRALNQAARELMLAQASDWAFIMKTGTMVDYAVRRTKEHLSNFNRLYHQVTGQNIDEGWLGHLEGKNNLFPDIDYRIYRSQPVSAAG